jgi:hypothetical protein
VPSFLNLLKRPTAFIPVLMSLVALSLVVAHVSLYGTAQQADEGTAAHIWQLLMAGQLPLIGAFALRWLPECTGAAVAVLGLQLLAGLTAATPVFLLQW